VLELRQVLDLRVVERVDERQDAAPVARALDVTGDLPACETVRHVHHEEVRNFMCLEGE
jgi:hypothetical protein